MLSKTTSDPFHVDRDMLFAIGNSNWDLYVAKINKDKLQRSYLYAIAKEGSGANNCCFGDLMHICNLIRDGHFGDEFTEFGRKLMEEAGYGSIVKEYERPKKWQIQFYDSYSVYGKCVRTEIVTTNCYSKAKEMAYDMQGENEHSNYVLELKDELLACKFAA